MTLSEKLITCERKLSGTRHAVGTLSNLVIELQAKLAAMSRDIARMYFNDSKELEGLRRELSHERNARAKAEARCTAVEPSQFDKESCFRNHTSAECLKCRHLKCNPKTHECCLSKSAAEPTASAIAHPDERHGYRVKAEAAKYSKEWCAEMARLEEGHDVTAGSPAPQPEVAKCICAMAITGNKHHYNDCPESPLSKMAQSAQQPSQDLRLKDTDFELVEILCASFREHLPLGENHARLVARSIVDRMNEYIIALIEDHHAK